VWAALELVTGKSQLLEGVEVHEVEATTPIQRALVRRVVLTSGLTMRGNLFGFGMLCRWSIRSKVIRDSDQRRYSETTGPTTLIAWPVRFFFAYVVIRGGRPTVN
jgi:hypothetical protein